MCAQPRAALEYRGVRRNKTPAAAAVPDGKLNVGLAYALSGSAPVSPPIKHKKKKAISAIALIYEQRTDT